MVLSQDLLFRILPRRDDCCEGLVSQPGNFEIWLSFHSDVNHEQDHHRL